MSAKRTAGIEVIARGVAVQGGRVLLCASRQGGYAYLPGGHVEPGEAASAALARELREETGWRAQVGALLLAQEHRFEQGGRQRHELNLVFHVERLDPPPRADTRVGADPPAITSREPSLAFAWTDAEELAAADYRPASLRPWLAALLRQAQRGGQSAFARCPIDWRSD